MCVALVLASTAVECQEPARELPRDMVFGMVRSADGAPVPGARVELLSRPFGDLPAVGVADCVTATTDERGRFRAQILLGRAYTAWASIDDDGGVRVSAPQEAVFPHDSVVSDLSAPAAGLRAIEVEGLAAWAGHGPFHWRIEVESDNRIVAAGALDADGTSHVPALPRASADLMVLGDDGLPICSKRLRLGDDDGPVKLAAPAAPGDWLFVRDIDSEAPIAGARVLEAVGGVDVEIARTDARGLVRLPFDTNFRSHAFVVAPGRAIAGVQEGVEPANTAGVAWPPVPDGVAPDFHVHLGAGCSLSGAVEMTGGEPATDCTVVIDERAMHYRQKNSRTLQGSVRAVPVGPDGRFEVESVLAQFPPCLHVVLGPKTMRGLPQAWTAGGLVPVVFAAFAGSPKWSGAVALEPLVLADCVPVRIVIEAADGAPAVNARVALSPILEGSHLGPPRQLDLRADRRGELALLLSPTASVGIGIEQGGDMQFLQLTAAAGDRVTEPLTVPITLSDARVVHGHAVDPAGRPAAGVALRLLFAATRPRPRAQRESGETTLSLPRLEVGALDDAATGNELVRRILPPKGQIVRTDEKGAFTFRVPDQPLRLILFLESGRRPLAQYRLGARGRHRGRGSTPAVIPRRHRADRCGRASSRSGVYPSSSGGRRTSQPPCPTPSVASSPSCRA